MISAKTRPTVARCRLVSGVFAVWSGWMVWRRLLSRSWLWHARSGRKKFPPRPQPWTSRDVLLTWRDLHRSCFRLAGACRVAVVQGFQQVMGIGGAYCPCLRRMFARFAKSSQIGRPSSKSDRGVAIGRCWLHRGSSVDLLKIGNASDPALVVCKEATGSVAHDDLLQ